MSYDYAKYLRKGKLPHIWCAGCSYGMVLKSLIRAIDSLQWDKNDVAIVSGIGCASRLPGYVDFNTLHTTHGRAIAFATGLKLANPKLNVLAMGGDGDMTAIGGNHFIHACRRNLDMTIFVFNNNIYGMTGAQYSPTTPQGAWATTSPYGMAENNFNITDLAIGSGATYVARTTAYHVAHCEKIMKEAFLHKGTSVVEIINSCPTGFGRKNKFKTPASMLMWMKDNAVNVERAKNMSPEELTGKFTIGVLHKVERPEYLETYDAIVGLKK